MTSARRRRATRIGRAVGAHLWLTSLAFATPPDPAWLPGLFDDGDYDDIVLAIMAMTAVVPALPDPAETVLPVACTAQRGGEPLLAGATA